MHAPADELRPPTDREFRLFQKLVYEHAGIHLAPVKRALLSGRLSRRIRDLGLKTFGAYYDFVQEHGEEERTQLIDRITTNETSFFREPRQFDFLAREVLPRWQSQPHARPLRVWSAGCSTGEEPYSIAMVARETLGDGGVEITATDVSMRALREAAAGEWPMSKASQIPKVLLRSYMWKGIGPNGGKFAASPQLRAMIAFSPFNLNDDMDYGPLRGRFDVIFCRNVLIYFDHASKARVLANLLESLASGGYLFVGHAESLNAVAGVRCVEPTIYERANEART
ncbi:MAG: CheR family methyltransferase [Thermoanaerobaculia bacterium]